MSDKPGTRLRELARRYAEGRVSRGNYLAMRTALLDAATGVPEGPKAEQPPVRDALADAPMHEDLSEDATFSESPGSEQPSGNAGQAPVPKWAAWDKRRLLTRTVLSGVVTVAIFGALWLVLPGSQPEVDVSTAAAPQAVIAGKPGSPSAESQVAEFMARDDWHPGAVADFLSNWERLPASQRHAALRAAWFRALADELNERITEQQALADISGQGGASAEYQSLIEFAERLGLR